MGRHAQDETKMLFCNWTTKAIDARVFNLNSSTEVEIIEVFRTPQTETGVPKVAF